MLFGFAIILIILWFLAIFGSYAVGATVDLLLVVAVLVLVVELCRGSSDRDSGSASDHIANPDGGTGVTAGAVVHADGLTVVLQSGDDIAAVSTTSATEPTL